MIHICVYYKLNIISLYLKEKILQTRKLQEAWKPYLGFVTVSNMCQTPDTFWTR